ncbi:MAG: thioredoxin family protein [Lentisphaerae bacterium]|nr:thioredoxin family protein [Lentisphaerota bacterium]
MRHAVSMAVVLLLGVGLARAQDNVGVSAAWREVAAGRLLVVDFRVPAGYTLYANRIAVVPVGAITLQAIDIPPAKEKKDTFTDEMERVYDHDFTLTYTVSPAAVQAMDLDVRFQACDETVCFLPAKRRLTVTGGVPQSAEAALQALDARAGPIPVPPQSVSWQDEIRRFRIGATTSGFVPSAAFVAFLDRGEKGEGAAKSPIQEAFEKRGIWVASLLILLGGLLLNLTPCVLPMIPVNLAIIGAGAGAGSRWRGLALGSAYGVGIALVYGILGVVVVLTGASFGTLNASPWFNIAIAVIFLVLALGMFDVIHIDFSRFQSGLGSSGGGRGGLWTALLLGGVAALLAGACVAPVVIAVVLMATDLYRRGHQAGLLLPFLLGAGMALPWPLAGAGMSVLPRPGRWMERIKMAFGLIIVLVALWYGRLGLSLLRERSAARQPAAGDAVASAPAEGDWFTSLDDGLAVARREGRPVFIDFWASWCKNCLHMDKTTFMDAAVQARLAGFVKVKYRAEDPSDPPTKAVLDHFGARGLPFYVVLLPQATGP